MSTDFALHKSPYSFQSGDQPSDPDKAPLKKAGGNVADAPICDVTMEGRMQALVKIRDLPETPGSREAVIVPPVHRIAPELLLQIFSHYLPLLPVEEKSLSWKDKSGLFPPMNFAPWLISHVCQDWRKVVLGSPSCWSNVWIITRKSRWPSLSRGDIEMREAWTDLGYGVAMDLISRQITFSQNQPLQLFFDACDIRDDHYSAISSFVLAHQGRWESITIRSTARSLPNRRAYRRLFGILEAGSDFSLLKELQLRAYPAGPVVTSEDCGLPRLENVTMVGVLPWFGSLPWTNISFLTLGTVRLGDIHSILPVLPKLQTLIIQAYYDAQGAGGIPPNTPPIPLPSLRTLHIHDRKHLTLLNAIVTPSLCELNHEYVYYQGSDKNFATDIPSILSLIQRSSCSITSYEGTFLTSKSRALLSALLSALPDLTTLRVGMREWEDFAAFLFDDEDIGPLLDAESRRVRDPVQVADLMRALGAKNPDGSFSSCPLLANLEISIISEFEDLARDGDLLSSVDVCESRYDVGRGRLKSVFLDLGTIEIGFIDTTRSDLLARLKGLRRAGLELEVPGWPREEFAW